VEHGKQMEKMLADLYDVTLNILEEVKGQREDIAAIARTVQELLAEHRIADRPVQPLDSLSIRSPVQRGQVAGLMTWYQKLPKEQLAQLPALLNGIGKLLHGSGDVSAAQGMFAEVAAMSREAEAKAEAQHNAYLAAVERREWAAALAALKTVWKRATSDITS
jgi:hypothetical protein